ncbi:hypothetical protein BD410DRAFT_812914 [Rickenella mellea]|uniref:J domain-containing protein n=1 Tax=Rickenella mellea TaxID=50990 RepID=A0A4Y7QI56_9AGAM|nr:hypothetical protein BD410DRAFT_812914 [Rickenella mellea]
MCTSPFPFPRKPRATPYEIFHLPPGSPPSAIKSRYYELVRVHHPDSPRARTLPPRIAHARFQAITAAYDILTGKSNSRFTSSEYAAVHRYGNSSYGHRMRHGSEWAHTGFRSRAASVEDGVSDRVIMAIGAITLAFGFAPFLYASPQSIVEERHRAARRNLTQARSEAREYGEERLREARRRVRQRQRENEYATRIKDDG